jgi:hypothetical protein
MWWGQGKHGNSLYVLLNFTTNLTLLFKKSIFKIYITMSLAQFLLVTDQCEHPSFITKLCLSKSPQSEPFVVGLSKQKAIFGRKSRLGNKLGGT